MHFIFYVNIYEALIRQTNFHGDLLVWKSSEMSPTETSKPWKQQNEKKLFLN